MTSTFNVLFVVLCILCAALYYLQVVEPGATARARRVAQSSPARQFSRHLRTCALKQPVPLCVQNKGSASAGGMPTTSDFKKFQRSYLIVYVCAVMGDWSLSSPPVARSGAKNCPRFACACQTPAARCMRPCSLACWHHASRHRASIPDSSG